MPLKCLSQGPGFFRTTAVHEGIPPLQADHRFPLGRCLNQTGVGAERRETAWEMTYRAQINEHLLLQPDIQYVQNPSASAELDDALVIGIRFVIAY